MDPTTLLLEALYQKTNFDPRSSGSGWITRCPAHDDHNPSLSVSEGADGRALFNCLAGCSQEAVLSALGLNAADLFNRDVSAKPQSSQRSEGFRRQSKSFETAEAAIQSLELKRGKCSGKWAYHSADGELVGMVLRWDREGGKDIMPLSKIGGQWQFKAMPSPRPLYRLPELAKAGTVFITEGEKAADAAVSIGLNATTSAGGSKAAKQTDWSPLAGRDVVVVPDNDVPGAQYAETVADMLHAFAKPATVRIVDLKADWPELPDAGDLADWCDHHDAVEPETLRERIEALAVQAEVLEPLAIPSRTTKFIPFPVDQLPPVLARFVSEGAQAIGCDPSYIALPLLVSLGAMVGDTRRLKLKESWMVPPIIWAANVGRSGTSKSPALDVVLDLLRDVEKSVRREISDPVDAEKFRIIVGDSTVEALASIFADNSRGLLGIYDELGALLGSFDRYKGSKAGGDVQQFLSMFGARNLRVDRKGGEKKTIFVERAALSIFGNIPPKTLRQFIGVEHKDNGLLQRFLFANPPFKPKQWTDATISKDATKVVFDVMLALSRLEWETNAEDEKVPLVIAMTDDATEQFSEFFNEHNKSQAKLDESLGAAFSKLEEYPARLALIIHLCRSVSGESVDPLMLDSQSIEAGINLTRWFANETCRVYAILERDKAEDEVAELVEWITQQGGRITARDLQTNHRRYRSPGDAEAVLEGLVKSGYGVWESVAPTSKGGRPTMRFCLQS